MREDVESSRGYAASERYPLRENRRGVGCSQTSSLDTWMKSVKSDERKMERFREMSLKCS